MMAFLTSEKAEWFTRKDIVGLARKFKILINLSQAKKLKSQLNKIAYQFFTIDWPIQQGSTHTEIRKQLEAIETSANSLLDHLDKNILDLLQTGTQISTEKQACKQQRISFAASAKAKEDEQRKIQLIEELPSTIQATITATKYAKEINNIRITRTNNEKVQNKGDKALNNLILNLLRIWQCNFGKKVTHTHGYDPITSSVDPSETVNFIHDCLQTIRQKISEDYQPNRSQLMNRLNSNVHALRERLRRIPRE